MAPSQLGLHLRWEGLTYDVAVATPAAAAAVSEEPHTDAEEGTAAAAHVTAPPTPPGVKRILHAVSGQVLPGQLLAVAGPSGSGAWRARARPSALRLHSPGH